MIEESKETGASKRKKRNKRKKKKEDEEIDQFLDNIMQQNNKDIELFEEKIWANMFLFTDFWTNEL